MPSGDAARNPPDRETNAQSVRRTIQIVSWTGAAPIVVFAILMVVFGGQSGIGQPLADAYKIYAALILSFLGGIRWGMILAGDATHGSLRTIIGAPAAPLIGWGSVFISGPMGFALLIVAFAGQGAWDNIAAHEGRLPIWFARTRMILTVIAATSLAVTMYVIA